MRASVAQIEVALKLEPTLENEEEFLDLFKNSLKGNEVDEYRPNEAAHQGAKILKDLMSRNNKFTIQCGKFAYEHNFSFNDPIFSLRYVNNSVQAEQTG